MNGIHTFFIIVGLLIIYILVINFLAGFLIGFPLSRGGDGFAGGRGSSYTGVELGVSDSVSVSVSRQRFYGRIFEAAGDSTTISHLYLFNFLKLPLRVNHINFIYFHVGMIVLLFILLIVLSLLES